MPLSMLILLNNSRLQELNHPRVPPKTPILGYLLVRVCVCHVIMTCSWSHCGVKLGYQTRRLWWHGGWISSLGLKVLLIKSLINSGTAVSGGSTGSTSFLTGPNCLTQSPVGKKSVVMRFWDDMNNSRLMLWKRYHCTMRPWHVYVGKNSTGTNGDCGKKFSLSYSLLCKTTTSRSKKNKNTQITGTNLSSQNKGFRQVWSDTCGNPQVVNAKTYLQRRGAITAVNW